MASLQNTFHYEGNSSNSPIESVLLFFDIPTYKFETVLRDGRPFPERVHLGAHTLQVHRALNSADYFAPFASELLIGSTDLSVTNFHAYYAAIDFEGDDARLASLSANIRLHIKDEHENGFGESAFDALYSFSTASEHYADILARQRALNTSVAFDEGEADKLTDELIDYLRANIFLINRERFDEAAAQFRTVEPRFNDFAFLLILSHVTEVAEKPRINIALDKFKAYLKSQFGIGEARTIKTLQKVLKDALFDFPVTVPEITAVEIKGTLTLLRTDSTSTSLAEFGFYDLTTEYGILAPDGTSDLATNHFDWSTAAQPTGNTAPFSFGTVITNLVSSDIDVRVKAHDGSVVWERQYASTDAALGHIAIEVPLVAPVVLTDPEPPSTGGHKKLSGKVVELSATCPLKDIIIVVEAQKAADAPWSVVGTATTDNSGNFSMPYPYGNYTAARAYTSLTPDSPVDIPVNTDAAHLSTLETIADDFLYLLLKDVTCEDDDHEHDDDCACQDADKANRLPSQADLIQSDSYTQDVGGSCVNLSVPNRTLSEYRHQAVVRTSDPDVSNYVLTKDAKGNFVLEGGLSKIARKPVDLGNPIRWQDAPDDHNNLSLYQAVTVATGHVLHYSVTTKADGYSLGELLASLPLAPGQKKQIVVFDQTHTLTGSETQRLSQSESLAASLVNDVSITDTLAGNLSEATQGGSSANTGGVSAGLGLAGIVEGIAGVFGVSGGFSNANSTAWQNSSRELSQHFNEQIKNAINQNAQSYRELNASVVTTVQEGQNYGVTAEVIANHNHCHSLTMMYFEVLRHYAIYQELIHVEECLFVPLLMTDFTRENIFKWRDVLAAALLPMPSETYLQPFNLVRGGRQHPLLKGFDAIERIKTNYENVDFPAGAYDDEVMNFITGEIYIYTNLPRPKSKYDRIKSWPLEKKSDWSWPGALIGGVLGGPLGFIVGGYLNADGSVKAEANPIIDDYIYVDANYASVPPAQCIRVRKFDSNFFEAGGFDKAQWEAYASLLGKNVLDMLSYYFKDRLISEWDSIFYNDIAPLLFERICNNISLGGFSALDFSSEAKYKGNFATMKVNLRGTGSNKKRNEISQLQLAFANTAGLSNDLVTLSVRNVSIRYSTAHYNGAIYSGYVGDDLVDGSLLYTPENANEKRNPKKEDAYIAARLVEHLNSNLEHYNRELFQKLDPDRRLMLLDGFLIETYNDFGVPIGKRSLASVVKNDLVGISGNALIMPVAPGYKVDRSYVIEQPIEGPAVVTSLFDHYKPLTPIPPYRISIPSKGVFAEAVQGACDACEKVKDNTSQDWDKFKTDEPTAINPVTVPVPTVTDWRAAFKDLATPIVNIQNAPATPAPGAGLAASTTLLGQSGLFKDITGLDQNQKNALQTYLSNQENAKAFGEMAKEIFMMGHNTEKSDKIADSIRNSPELSQQEKAQLLKDHFGQMVDGGQSKKAEQAQQNTKPTLTDAAVKAADQGKAVKATSADASGNVASVDISAGAEGENVLAEVKGFIQNLLQANSNACWATAATIMMSWKKGTAQNVQDVLTLAGDPYVQLFAQSKALPSSMKDDFITKLGMVGEPPASYLLQKYIDWVNTYGPIWITTDSSAQDGVFSPHARILVKITGTGTPDGIGTFFTFIDPATGTLSAPQPYNDFLKVYEQMVTDNPGSLFIQIVHFADAITGEGQAVPNRAMTKVDGIDVHFPVAIPSWNELDQAKIQFIIHRCSEQQEGGALIGDTDAHVVAKGSPATSSFPQRWAATGANFLIRGAYHFYRYNVGTSAPQNGDDQAEMVASMVSRLLPGDLAPALDFEGKYLVAALAATPPGAVDLRDDIDLFLDGVETRLGRTPWVYTAYFPIHDHIASQTDFVAADFAHLAEYPLWLKVYPYATADGAYANRTTIDPTNIKPTKPAYPRDWVPSMWNDDWAILQYLGDNCPSTMTSLNFAATTDWNITHEGIYALRGLADLGHTAPHIVGSQSFIAHVDNDGRVLVRTHGTAWTEEDVTLATSTPLAMGDVAAIGNGNQQVLLYRSRVNNHVIALSRDVSTSSAWTFVDATAEGAGVAALDDPLMLVVSGTVEAVHWGSGDHHSHLRTDAAGAWHGADLSSDPAAPAVSGSAAIYRHQNVTRVVGRAGEDGHLLEFSRDGSAPLGTDLTNASTDGGGAHPPAATYRPSVYTPGGGAPRIVFRALRGELWEIERDTLVARNLTTAAGAPKAAGSPSAVFVSGAMHTLHRTKDGRIIDLFATATGFDSQEVPCDVRAAADPTAYVDGGNVAVTYRAIDGTIHRAELVGGAWTCEDTAP